MRRLLLLLSIILSGALAAPAQAAKFDPAANVTTPWTRAQALKIRTDPTTTKPLVDPDFPVMTNEVWVWDTWPLTRLDGRAVTVNGWHVIFSLVAPRNIPFGDRHWVAKIGYFYSRDARSWKYGGLVFPRGTSFGSREWAGSSVLTGRRTVQVFYTASGRDNPPRVDPSDALQRLATASGRIVANNRGVTFRGFRNHKIIAEPDGVNYQTPQQAGGPDYAFRDPYAFRNPEDRQVYITFEGNTAGPVGSHPCTARENGPVPPGHQTMAEAGIHTGNVGLMRATSRSLRSFALLPPLISANCVNRQTERPHFVFRDGLTYLFTISHISTFAPGVTGPDGVYGFVGESIRSDYEPMNGSALVLGNPPEAPLQQYSEFVMPNLLVESFIDQVPLPGGGIREGGTLARTLQIELDGNRSYLVGQLDYGFIPGAPSRPWESRR
jgi:levansucrase